jgi:FkbM family methyltransferase
MSSRPPSLSRFFQRLGLFCVRTSHPAAHYLRHPPSSAFESVLLRLFPDLRGLRFIQVGANDGRRADPICTFIDAYAWNGLMIEPLAKNFADLRSHRGAAAPRIRLRQAAVDLVAGRRLVHDLAPSATANLPDWTRGLASFSRERVALAAAELGLPESAIVAEEIDTITWDQVWQEFGAQPCDLLVLDTEGYDLPLLRAASLARHRPRVIHFEHACATVEDRHAFYQELTDIGYELATDGPDTTAWLPL